MGSEDAVGLLVTDADFTPSAQRLIQESPRLSAVRWRNRHDDRLLAEVLASLLRG